MADLVLEDKLGQTNIGKDWGLSNLVEGGIYTSLAMGAGIVSGVGMKDVADFAASNFGVFGGAALYNPIIPFFSFAAGIGHGLGEPGSKEKLLTGGALGVTVLYSLQQTLHFDYGISVPYYLMQVAAGNLTLGGYALMQAVVPVLAIFGAGYVIGKFARWITGRSKKVTKRRRRKKKK
ncbi:MAG: hypothetical protein ABIB47_01940 [Candidatus Woesearchaeota archaeon]